MKLQSETGQPIRAYLVDGRWEFKDSSGPTGFYLDRTDKKQFRLLRIIEFVGEHTESKQDLTIYPSKL